MKFSGKIGFAEFYESSPGVWEERIIEKPCKGDVLSNQRPYSITNEIVANVNVNNRFSIVLSPYTEKNFGFMRYVLWRGVRWNVKDVSIAHPRLNFSMGGVYNGPGPNSDQETDTP